MALRAAVGQLVGVLVPLTRGERQGGTFMGFL
jgi:hypothetical protein